MCTGLSFRKGLRILEKVCLLLLKALKMIMRAINDTMALAHSGTHWWYKLCKCHGTLNPPFRPAQSARNEYPPNHGYQLCRSKGQLIVQLFVDFARPYTPLQTGAKLWHTERELHGAKCAVPPRHVPGKHSLAESKEINIWNTAT